MEYTRGFSLTMINAWAATGQTIRTAFFLFVILKVYHNSSNI